MRFTVDNVEIWKESVTSMIDLIPGGVVFGTADLEIVTWKQGSKVFDISQFGAGVKLRPGGAAFRCTKTRKEERENVPRDVYGTRITMIANPVYDGEEVVGSTIMIFPRMHPVASAFNDFAPLIGEMFPEGATLYITSLTEFAYRYDSQKFGFPDIVVGSPVKENSPAKQAMNTRQPVVKELPPEFYGKPVQVLTFPLFDGDEVVGTFGMGLPRENAGILREMATGLSRGLEEISAAIEEMAASAMQVTDNERHLNENINDIYHLSEDINDIMSFIKQIADETKMLGLNAAIEAARAGDVGKGFGVVAEEIRKLSDESKGTVVKIKELTDKIKDKIVETSQGSELTLRSSEEQAAASQEITASIEEIRSMAEKLDVIAKDM